MKLYTFPIRSTTEASMEQYINSFSGVMNYCNQVEKLKIPIPAHVPIWYQEGLNRIVTAKTNAGLWKSAVSKNLIQLPQNILYYKPVYQEKSSIIQNSLKILSDRPGEESTRQHALKNIFELDKALTGQVSSIDWNVKQIQTFEQKFQLDIANMQEISAKALHDQRVSQANIKKIKDDITELEGEISQYDTWITLGEVAMAGGLAVVGLGLMMTAGTAATVVIVIGIVVAALGLIEFIILEIMKSVAASKLIKKKKELTEEESTVTSMQVLQSRLSTALNSSKELQSQMHGMKGLWTSMGDFAMDMRRMLEEEKASLNREVLLRTVQNLKQADITAENYYNMAAQLKGMKFNNIDREEIISA